jgi:hypothetical protein
MALMEISPFAVKDVPSGFVTVTFLLPEEAVLAILTVSERVCASTKLVLTTVIPVPLKDTVTPLTKFVAGFESVSVSVRDTLVLP